MKYLKEFENVGKLQKHCKSDKYVMPNVYITKDNQEVKLDMTSDDEIVCIYDVKNSNENFWTTYTNPTNLYKSITIDGVKWNNLQEPANASSYYDSNKSSNIHILKFKLKVKDFDGLTSAPLFYNNHLEYIHLPEGFKTITDNMFNNCFSLREISLPNSLKKVGNGSFYGCSSLKEIYLNEGLITLGQNIFNNCSSLEKINFPSTLQNGITTNDYTSFVGCPLKYVYIDTPLITTFYSGVVNFPYTNLQTLEFGPHALTNDGKLQFSFGGYSFNNVNIKLPEGLLSIPSMSGCNGINEIILPTTAQEFIGTFNGCSINLMDLSNTQISTLTYANSSSIYGGYSSGYSSGYGGSSSSAFVGAGIKKIILNNLITEIPANCFNGSSLIEITIPDSVMTIGTWAFIYCYNLTTVNMSEIVRNRITNHDVFSSCYNLSDSYVEGGIRYIDINDTVGADLIRVEDTTLEEYTIKTDYLPNNINSYVISNCKILRLTGEFTEIPNYKFSGFTKLETVILPNTLTIIGNGAFSGCTNLETLVIPESVTTIGENAFAGTKLGTVENGIRYLNLGNDILALSIADKTLSSYNIKNGTTRIEFIETVWDGINNIESITLPESLTYISTNSFNDICNILTDAQVDFILGINEFAIQQYMILLRKPKSYFTNRNLTIVALESGNISMSKGSGKYHYVYNSYDYYTSTVSISVSKGAVIEFYNDTQVLELLQLNFKAYICGNILSLTGGTIKSTFSGLFRNSTSSYLNIDKLVFPSNLTLPSNYGTYTSGLFQSMFEGCTGLTSIPADLLPASTISRTCYANMFKGCTGLTSLPEGLLHATSVQQSSYEGMFANCTNLVNVPENLLENIQWMSTGSCQYMFYGCTSLVKAPTIPNLSSSVSNQCSYMFQGCTSLNYIKNLGYYNSSCYRDWVKGVSSSGTFVKRSDVSTWPTGDSGIPSGWSVEDYVETT